MLSVLVLSPTSRFLDLLGGALREAGVWAVCAANVNDAMHVVESGFRPRAVVLDPAAVLERGGHVLCGLLARSSALSKVPVFSVSAAVGRRELKGLLDSLRELAQDGHRAST